jgi:hypothetical protein
MNYDRLHELKRQLGRPVETLIALAPQNDPFYVLPARQKAAEWFAALWSDLPRPAHCRRIHYALLSRAEPVLMRDGSAYENTEECWRYLYMAIRDAVALGLVPADAIVDQRNDPPILHLADAESGEIWINRGSFSIIEMPSLPRMVFKPPLVPQPYHVEIWAEKSTQNDILVPLAERYRLNLLAGAGEASATGCRDLVKRAIKSGRPVRILYVSDFDPGGQSMPVAAARKIEHELYRRGFDLDIQLRPIALTYEQCIENRLPRIPLKETERRGSRFEQRFGEGATELDALEALKPGLLSQILIKEIGRYYDPDHDERLKDAWGAVREEIAGVEAAVYRRHKDAIDTLRLEWKAWRDKAGPLWRQIADNLATDAPEIVMPESQFLAYEDADPLFDSRRSYVEQIDRYKAHQGKPIEPVSFAATCKTCGKEFTAFRKDAAYCSQQCRANRTNSRRMSSGPLAGSQT